MDEWQKQPSPSLLCEAITAPVAEAALPTTTVEHAMVIRGSSGAMRSSTAAGVAQAMSCWDGAHDGPGRRRSLHTWCVALHIARRMHTVPSWP